MQHRVDHVQDLHDAGDRVEVVAVVFFELLGIEEAGAACATTEEPQAV